MLLRDMVSDGYYPDLVVDPEWYEGKHPQESLPEIEDPVSLWRPAPERDQVDTVVSIQGGGGVAGAGSGVAGGGGSGGTGGSSGDPDAVPGGGFGDTSFFSSGDSVAFGFEVGAPSIEVIPVPPDPDIGSVVLIVSAETANVGAQSFVADLGGHAFMWQATSGGPPTINGFISDAEAKFGTRSVYALEAGGPFNAAWSAPSSSDFNLTGDFTLETHIFIVDNSSEIPILSYFDAGQRSWVLDLFAGTNIPRVRVSTNGSNSVAIGNFGAANSIVNNQWQHLALTREGSTWRCWLEGNQLGPDIVNGTTLFSGSSRLELFAENGDAGPIEGYLDNIRITNGVARYDAPFTPPDAPYSLV